MRKKPIKRSIITFIHLQATYYNKNQLTSAKEHLQQQEQQEQQFTAHDAYLPAKEPAPIHRKTQGAPYQGPYNQEIYQQHQQQQQPYENLQHHQIKQFNQNGVKNNAAVAIQQKNILYAQTPSNLAFNNGQQQQQILRIQPIKSGKDIQQNQQQFQYVVAIPMSYLRQLQQQLLQQLNAPIQQHNAGKPTPNAVTVQQKQQQQPLGSDAAAIAGPLARDHQGTYRPFHRFAPLAVNGAASINAEGHYNLKHAPAPPGYITQYIQIPATVLLQAAQSAQLYQSPPAAAPQQIAYAHQQQPHQNQHQQTHHPPQYYHQYYPSQQQMEEFQRQPQQQIKQLPASQVMAPPPSLYAYQIQPQQALQYLQQPMQLHQTQHPHNLHTDAQLQQYNVGNQQQLQHQQQQHEQQIRGEGTTVNTNVAPHHQQHEPLNAHPHPHTIQHTNAHSQPFHNHPTLNPPQQHHFHLHHKPPQYQYLQQQPSPQAAAEVLTIPQAPPKSGNTHLAPAAAAPAYEHIVHYNPQYLVHYLQPQQVKHLKYVQSAQHPLHQVHYSSHGQQQQQQQQQQQEQQAQAQHGHHTPKLGSNLNNLHFSQGIHAPTPVPYIRLQPAVPAVAPAAMNPYATAHPFAANPLQPAFPPLGIPSKVTSFSNVLLQTYVGHAHGHPAAYQTTEIAAMGNAHHHGTIPYFNHIDGIHYGTHLYHPATPATPLTHKQDSNAVHLSPGAAAAAATPSVTSSAKGATAKTTEAGSSRTIVKYP